ncbi:MAG: hydrogenase nickel incorporation protein HypB [Dehalococcoidia bacterium]|jgi:hydrogenase nickel incorporation protein HypB
MEIKVLKDILSANDRIAQENRKLLDKKGVFAVNVMASPGAGKTSVILQTISGLKNKVRIGVIEGDVQSRIDADRIAKENVPVFQINTGGECHLDANMVQRALKEMPLGDIDILFIENIGNLICTAEFKIGTHKNLVIASVPEGHDKPLKYPLMFTVADVILVNKIDLLPYSNFDLNAYRKAVKGLNDKVEVIEISCTTGQGIKQWLEWIKGQESPSVRKP